MKQPAIQWYPGDARRDTALQTCPLVVRGLWREMIDLMHDGEPYGHLIVGGRPVSVEELARIVGESAADVTVWLDALEARQVFSRTEAGVIYSRRMVRDKQTRQLKAQVGRRGGNPALVKKRGEQMDRAAVIQAPKQKPTPAVAVADASAVAVADASAVAIAMESEAELEPTCVALEAFRKKFYPDVPARWADVLRQLRRTGVSQGRLARTLNSVIAKPPRLADRAVVFVLRKLEDTETDIQGRTVTERAAKTIRVDLELTEQWTSEWKETRAEWSKANPEALAAAEERARWAVQSPEDSSGWKIEYEARLNQELKGAAGFPDFEEWEHRRSGGGFAPNA